MDRDLDFWIRDCIRIIDGAAQIVARGEAAFFAADNSVEFGAARMVVLDLDVAADHLGTDFKAAHPEIPWSALARTRDKFAHHDEDINRDVVWNLLTTRLPRIARILRASLGDH